MFLVPVSCSSSEDCNFDNICKNSICYPQCKQDNDCAFNEKCLQGICQLTCRFDNDCFLGHICRNNICLYGCHNDNDCTNTESCRNNKCINPCHDSPCGPNALCLVSNHRATCSCLKGFVPNPSAKVACIRRPAEPCEHNKNCPISYACVEKYCRPLCSSDSGCVTNERCDKTTGICKPICRKDDDCRYNEICDGLTCIPGCRANAHCPIDKSCVDNKCIDECLAPTACGTNANCSVIDHKKFCTCMQPLKGNPYERCKFPHQICELDADCISGQFCNEGYCLRKCRT